MEWAAAGDTAVIWAVLAAALMALAIGAAIVVYRVRRRTKSGVPPAS